MLWDRVINFVPNWRNWITTLNLVSGSEKASLLLRTLRVVTVCKTSTILIVSHTDVLLRRTEHYIFIFIFKPLTISYATLVEVSASVLFHVFFLYTSAGWFQFKQIVILTFVFFGSLWLRAVSNFCRPRMSRSWNKKTESCVLTFGCWQMRLTWLIMDKVSMGKLNVLLSTNIVTYVSLLSEYVA